tara:strand:- start:1183 stop:1812 length:630 start_codon:yes stop_codon:yes gene_type:complete
MNLFIPIKEQSQRVPQKNFRLLPSGKPLWAHTVEKFTDFTLYIDTDSDDLIRSLKKYEHVVAYKRSNKLIGHDVSVCELIADCIKKFKPRGALGQIHVTSPFLKSSTLKNAFSYMENYGSVASCTKLHTRLWRKEDYGYCPINHNPLKLEQTQDLPPLFEENSAFYIFDPLYFAQSRSRICDNPYFYPLEYPENIDIDTEEEWKLVASV